MRILFLTLFDKSGASSRARVFQYMPFLKKEGIVYKVLSIMSYKLSGILNNHSSYPFVYRMSYEFIYNRLLRFLKYIYVIMQAPNYDIVFIQKVTMDAFLFKLLIKRNQNIVFDFDDNPMSFQGKINLLTRLVLSYKRSRLSYILRKSKAIIAGNRYLENIYKAYNRNIITIPTPVNSDLFIFTPHQDTNNKKIIIGWAGMGEYHIRHLMLLAEFLSELQNRCKFKFRLIGSRNSNRIKNMFSKLEDCEIIDWVEPEDMPRKLSELDIAVMPLIRDSESEGKCGLKILEYMSMGIPVVCSPVGVNRDIISDGENGFLAEDKQEWVDKLSRLIKNEQLRKQFSLRGRFTVEESYSCNNIFPKWMQALSSVKNN